MGSRTDSGTVLECLFRKLPRFGLVTVAFEVSGAEARQLGFGVVSSEIGNLYKRS